MSLENVGGNRLPIPSSTDSESQVCSDTSGVMDTDDAAEAGLCVETESAIRARIGQAGPTVPTPPTAPVLLTSSQSSDKTLLEVKESLMTPQKVRSKTVPASTPKRKVLKTKRALNETFEKLKGYGVERPGKVLKEP